MFSFTDRNKNHDALPTPERYTLDADQTPITPNRHRRPRRRKTTEQTYKPQRRGKGPRFLPSWTNLRRGVHHEGMTAALVARSSAPSVRQLSLRDGRHGAD